MGKKTKKTRWRTLSIGEGCSDTETSVNAKETPRNNQKYGRTTNGYWYNSNNQKYSNQSTPNKYENHRERNGRGQWNNGHYNTNTTSRSSNQETSKSTTRSSSTVSETKIKFNEDEYTRITTPRQDVLFKKGYLSKPKPYLQQQRSLTSTGNSTGDGTPDHQSADGNDTIDGDYDQSPFMFPSNPAFMDGMFFVNGFEPYAVPPHHVLVYDQYGNAVVCLPPPQLQPPPPQSASTSLASSTTTTTTTTTSTFNHRSKRYSTDSMTESTSPHNESNQDAASATDEPFLHINEEIPENENETRIRKKRRRKKIERNKSDVNADADETEEMISLSSDDELSSLSGDEGTTKCDTDEISLSSCKYRVDAEEFVPRCYRQQQQQQHMEFVPLPVGMPLYAAPATFVPTMFPLTNHQIFYNNPHHFNTINTNTNASSSTMTTEIETIEIATKTTEITNELEDKSSETLEINCDKNERNSNTTTNSSDSSAIDIAKIVSKLEEAAKEQQEIDTTTNNVNVNKDENVETKPNESNQETNKTESVPLQQQIVKQTTNITENIRYSERLKQSHNPPIKPLQQQKIINKQQKRTTNQTCPRLERSTSSRPKTNINHNNIKTNQLTTTIPTATATATSTSTSNNQWIAVSGKKKRGKNKQLLTEEMEESTITQTQIIVQDEEEEEEGEENKPRLRLEQSNDKIKIQEDPVIDIVEIKESVAIRNNPPKKQPIMKKRILINDGLIVAQNPKNLITKAELVAVEKTVVVVVPSTEEQKEQKEQKPQKQKKKSNKKGKNKNNNKTNECNNNIDDKLMNDLTSEQSEFDDVEETKETIVKSDAIDIDIDDDVSLELERMIQRGLYGNLEQRIRSFNPADSFIVDVLKQQTQNNANNGAAAVATASVIGTMAAAVLKKPSNHQNAYFGQTSINPVVVNGFIPPKLIISKSKDDAAPTGAGADQRFPITRAVREWMNKTRENTPEVEIFKNPNEIREEFNLIIDEKNETMGTIENGLEIDEIKVEDEIDEMSPQPQPPPPPPPLNIDDEDDLLDCWEQEINYDQCDIRRRSKSQSVEQQTVEQAEDVLETYESVYGRSDDFARIQREVQQQQQQQQQQQERTSLLNNNNNNNNNNLRVGGVGGVDGALPYRAICCSIM